jgi:hypothetical protein
MTVFAISLVGEEAQNRSITSLLVIGSTMRVSGVKVHPSTTTKP